jgi:hypothetical protein
LMSKLARSILTLPCRIRVKWKVTFHKNTKTGTFLSKSYCWSTVREMRAAVNNGSWINKALPTPAPASAPAPIPSSHFPTFQLLRPNILKLKTAAGLNI